MRAGKQNIQSAPRASTCEQPEKAPAIETIRVTKAFGARKALDSVSLELPQGGFLSIFGPNGAGKTTLLRVLSTLARPSSGKIRICGIDAHEQPDEIRRSIGLISHQPMLYADLTAEENLAFYAELYNVSSPQVRARELLETVGLAHRRHDTVRTFSRGMTQRLSIARALVHDPTVLLLDEPYSGLDPRAIEVLDELLESLRGNRTFVMVSHDLDKGLSLCTHALVLARGSVAAFADKESIDFDSFSQAYRAIVGMGVA